MNQMAVGAHARVAFPRSAGRALALQCASVLLAGCISPSPPIIDASKPEIVQLEPGDNSVTSDESVEVAQDAVYQRPKHYRGMTLLRYLKSRGFTPTEMVQDSVVQFLCNDGYNPVAPLADLLKDDAFLATG